MIILQELKQPLRSQNKKKENKQKNNLKTYPQRYFHFYLQKSNQS
jgi:hypothetical protein